MDSDTSEIRELIRNRILSTWDCVMNWTDRSINRYWPTWLTSRTGVWRNVGADCLVGGTRELEVCVFYSPFGNIRFSLSEVTTPTLSCRTASSCEMRRVKTWLLSCVGWQRDAITSTMHDVIMIRWNISRFFLISKRLLPITFGSVRLASI